MKRFFLILLLIFGAFPALAGDVQTDFQKLAAALARSDAPEAKSHLTAASYPLYDRFVSYGLMDCLPGDVKFYNSAMDGKVAVTKGTFRSPKGKMQLVTLAFVEDAGSWKLDLPETLRRAFGKGWEGIVSVTESIYLALRSSAGKNLTCEQIEGVTGK